MDLACLENPMHCVSCTEGLRLLAASRHSYESMALPASFGQDESTADGETVERQLPDREERRLISVISISNKKSFQVEQTFIEHCIDQKYGFCFFNQLKTYIYKPISRPRLSRHKAYRQEGIQI